MSELSEVAQRNAEEWKKGNSYHFMIEFSRKKTGVGRITIRRDKSPGTWNIGYWIHPDHWGQGYATEAGRAILDFGRSSLSAAAITTAHAVGNVASQKVIEKLGFRRTNENPCGFIKNGSPVREYEYVIDIGADKPGASKYPGSLGYGEASSVMSADHHKNLQSLEIELASPDTRADVSRISELLAEDFAEFGSSGKIIRKSDILAGVGAGTFPTYELSDFTFRELAEDITLVKYRSFVSGRRALRSSIWVNNNGNWQLLHHQSTVVPEVTKSEPAAEPYSK
jgi:GNAT superfamily N-acetyltransferase